MQFANDVFYIQNLAEILDDPKKIQDLRDKLLAGNFFIARGAVDPSLLDPVKHYLTQVGRSSLPNYVRIEKDCPNFHRINREDPRAYVKGCFHQFSFFPWNQDPFNFFEWFQPIYHLKNLTSGLARNAFLGFQPEDQCIARLSFQFYPSGSGRLHRHGDPVDYHQLTVPTLIMSQKGKDFQHGGAYIVAKSGEQIFLEDLARPGDAIFFNARIPHGVTTIDPEEETHWLDFKGRWMLLFAVNKLFDNPTIGNSQEMEED